VTFPAVSGAESAVEKLVDLFPWNLETDKPFAQGNGLMAPTAFD
jgi:hypothetical protein